VNRATGEHEWGVEQHEFLFLERPPFRLTVTKRWGQIRWAVQPMVPKIRGSQGVALDIETAKRRAVRAHRILLDLEARIAELMQLQDEDAPPGKQEKS